MKNYIQKRVLLDSYTKNRVRAESNNVELFLDYKLQHSGNTLKWWKKIKKQDFNLQNFDHKLDKLSDDAICLHDVWRFFEISKDWNKLLTWTAFDHGSVWKSILKKYWISDPRILLPVFFHNKLNLDWLYSNKLFLSAQEETKKEIEIICRLVRDSDKLANLLDLKDWAETWNFEELANFEDFSPEIFEEFKNSKTISREKVQTKADSFLQLVSWIFDLNFRWTKKILFEQEEFDLFVLGQIHHFRAETFYKVKQILENYLEKNELQTI